MRQFELSQIKNKAKLSLWLGLLLLLTAACNTEVAAPPPPPAAAPTGEVADPAANPPPAIALQWSGSVRPTGEPGNSCRTLTITADGKTTSGPCEGEMQDVSTNLGQEWPEIVARFAPFETEPTPDERIVFNGQGQLAGPAWERAVTAWARLASAQLSSGQVSATGPTVLAWNLGEMMDPPGACRRLIVLESMHNNN